MSPYTLSLINLNGIIFHLSSFVLQLHHLELFEENKEKPAEEHKEKPAGLHQNSILDLLPMMINQVRPGNPNGANGANGGSVTAITFCKWKFHKYLYMEIL